MPLPQGFAKRLLPILQDLVDTYGSPFHVYDAQGIVETHDRMTAAFHDHPYRQFFAVKATPNPAILTLLRDRGSGFDCSSTTEIALAASVGATGGDVVFTSNNTDTAEYRDALRTGAIITFDDVSFLDKFDALPDTVAFRISPHGRSAKSALMGDTLHSKFGVPVERLPDAYRRARALGVRRFGIHGMSCANELDGDRAVEAATGVLAVGAWIESTTGVELEYVNVGGGHGIPYRERDAPLDFPAFARQVVAAARNHFPTTIPRILTELGRSVTGPHGVLVSRVINRVRKGCDIVGLDSSMSSLMRPAIYGAYHHISLPLATGRTYGTYDVVGSLCENMDKFGLDRRLPEPREGDIVLVHDTGAHGHAMGFNYNGRLRPPELLFDLDGSVVEIRRAETFDDYVRTVNWTPTTVRNGSSSQLSG